MHRWIGNLALPVTMVEVALGLMIAFQPQTQNNVTEVEQMNGVSRGQVESVLSNSQVQNTKLQENHRVLLAQLNSAREKVGIDPRLIAELDQLQILEGTQAVDGPGIQINIDDSKKQALFPLSPEEIATMINTLKFAGAEAISLNDQRIVGSTAIVLSGSSTILVNQVPINSVESAHYELNAIGNQDTLLDYFSKLEAPGLKQKGLTVSIVRKALNVPSYKRTYTFKHAEPLIVP